MTMEIKDIAAHLKKIDFCMLSTGQEDGTISSRPMSNNGDVEFDGDCWFFSYEQTGKVAAIRKNANVSLTFTAPPHLLGKPGIFIVIDGKASVIADQSTFEDHWVSGLERWFPEGVKTPGLVLVKVAARSVQYWDGEEQGTINLPRS
jgi:general stress protein 26